MTVSLCMQERSSSPFYLSKRSASQSLLSRQRLVRIQACAAGRYMLVHPPRRRVKRVRFGKLAFWLQNGGFFWPKIGDFRPFRTMFSVRNWEMPIFIVRKRCKFRRFRTTFQAIWQIGIFTAERRGFGPQNR